ncbi:hypothetical protein [Candidatus Pantoea soli]|uniref:Uncharacterized protein n=1 Tax=Candidatus Pantoea soli TaxID=3098669 RepID=A0A518XBZ8_9GAMM|nr:hypothetical protein [Pantoea soli]QDY41712.1 hypothetical protein D8B20_07315 [Pantoea soli]
MNNDELSSRHYPVKENMRWQQRESRIQRAGEYLLMVIVILGACGLFSKGFLSDGKATAADGSVTVEYERFGRVQSNMNMHIRVASPAGDRFTLTLGGGAINSLQIQTLQPQPLQAVTRGDDLQLTFATHDLRARHSVWLGLQAQAVGRVPVSVSVDGQQPVHFSHWIYP